MSVSAQAFPRREAVGSVETDLRQSGYREGITHH